MISEDGVIHFKDCKDKDALIEEHCLTVTPNIDDDEVLEIIFDRSLEMNADLNVAPEFDPNVFVLDVPDSSSIVSNSNNSLFPTLCAELPRSFKNS